MLLFIACGGNFDLACFSSYTPIFGLLAKHTAAAARHTATVNRIVLVFMVLLFEQQLVRRNFSDPIGAKAMLGLRGAVGKIGEGGGP